MRFSSGLGRISIAFSAALMILACGRDPSSNGRRNSSSDLLVSDVTHSTVKRQSIGNCWLYAASSWLESLSLGATGSELDVSESYWTWWHFYDQIAYSSITELQTGGFWSSAANIILRHGYVLEGEFIGAETGLEMSGAQSRAVAYINNLLKPGGPLGSYRQRTPDAVRYYLDQAFGSNMSAAESIARSAFEAEVAQSATGRRITLAQALQGNRDEVWSELSFPIIYGQYSVPNAGQEAARKSLFMRVFKALNAKKPVVMSLMIDFNGLDIRDATFKGQLLRNAGAGVQGGHLLALEDYTVDNVPGYGSLGRGDMPDQVKAAAARGSLNQLIAKNSWGKNRPDRGLTDGYTGFDSTYLTGQFPWKSETSSRVEWFTTTTAFVLPPGF